MGKTNELRKTITAKLKKHVDNVYFRRSQDDSTFPYCVFSFDNISFDARYRDDNVIIIDIWDKSENPTNLINLKDTIEEEFNEANEPGTIILPTFYIDTSFILDDEDITLQHAQIRVLVQNYYTGE